MNVLGCWVDKPREKEGLYNAANIRIYAFDFMLLLLSVSLLKHCDVENVTENLGTQGKDRKFCGQVRGWKMLKLVKQKWVLRN
jgi:hypothetical protein